MARKSSLQSVAEELGISKVTVWRAVNNQPGISRELRDKILDHMRRTDCRIAPGRPRETIGIKRLAYFVSHRFFLENEKFYTVIYYHLHKLALLHNITLSLFVVSYQDEHAGLLPDSFDGEAYDGAFIGGEIMEPYLQALRTRGCPLVMIDFYSPRVEADCVITDNFFLGYQMTSRLLEMGHRDIGFAGGFQSVSNIMDRYLGYVKALRQAGMEPNSQWTFAVNDPVTGLYSMNFALPDVLPTAVVCHCDMAAYYLIERLKMVNKSVPEDISVVGFDNTELCTQISPQLTTVEISRRQFAQIAFDTLCRRISTPEEPYSRQYVPCKLIVRESARNI